jgi:hypothetical protein
VSPLIEKIPFLTDEEVANLLANARRLAETGDERQMAAAKALLPDLEAAAEDRRQQRVARAQAKRVAARRTPRKAAA